MTDQNRYEQIIEHIFLANYTPGATEVTFTREDIVGAAAPGPDCPF